MSESYFFDIWRRCTLNFARRRPLEIKLERGESPRTATALRNHPWARKGRRRVRYSLRWVKKWPPSKEKLLRSQKKSPLSLNKNSPTIQKNPYDMCFCSINSWIFHHILVLRAFWASVKLWVTQYVQILLRPADNQTVYANPVQNKLRSIINRILFPSSLTSAL